MSLSICQGPFKLKAYLTQLKYNILKLRGNGYMNE